MKPLLTLVQYSRHGIKNLCYAHFVNKPLSSFRLCSQGLQTTLSVVNKRWASSNRSDESGEHNKNEKKTDIIGSVTESGKYKLFKDEDAPLILDVIEERQRIKDMEQTEHFDEFAGLNLKRGVTGVFDIEDLVEVLQKENAQDIFVATLPPQLQYVDYIVVVSGKSLKHMTGMAEFIRRLYKIKRNSTDLIPRLEGASSADWLAIDLGNIALHILSSAARPIYDIETLWAVGKDYDENCSDSEDRLAEILQKHAININNFQTDDVLR